MDPKPHLPLNTYCYFQLYWGETILKVRTLMMMVRSKLFYLNFGCLLFNHLLCIQCYGVIVGSWWQEKDQPPKASCSLLNAHYTLWCWLCSCCVPLIHNDITTHERMHVQWGDPAIRIKELKQNLGITNDHSPWNNEPCSTKVISNIPRGLQQEQ